MEDYTLRLDQALLTGATGAIKSVTEWMLDPDNHHHIIPALFLLQQRGCAPLPSSTALSSAVPFSSSSSVVPSFTTSLYALYIGNDLYFTAVGRRNTLLHSSSSSSSLSLSSSSSSSSSTLSSSVPPSMSILRDHLTFLLSLLPLTLDMLLTMSIQTAKDTEEQQKVATISELWYRHQVLQAVRPVVVPGLPPPSSEFLISSTGSSVVTNATIPTSYPIPSLSSAPPTSNISIDITTLPVGYMVNLFQKYQTEKNKSVGVPSNSGNDTPYLPLPEHILTPLSRSEVRIEQGRLEARITDYVQSLTSTSTKKSSSLQPSFTTRYRKRTRTVQSSSSSGEYKPRKLDKQRYLQHAFDRYYTDSNNASSSSSSSSSSSTASLSGTKMEDAPYNPSQTKEILTSHDRPSRTYEDQETVSEYRGLGFG